MMLFDAKNVGSATGGVTSSSPGKDKASYAQAFDGTANTGTTTTVKPGSGPTASPGANASKVPAGVAKFSGDRV
jgi:hypothetical protein